MKIVVDEKVFKEIFRRALIDYKYNHEFMYGDENTTKFKDTKRYHMLMRFRATLKSLKIRLMEE